MTKPYLPFLAVGLALVFSGCASLVPTSRKENAATRVTDSAASKAGFDYALKVDPKFWPSVTVSNIGKGSVAVSAPAAYEATITSSIDAKAGSKDWFDYSFIQQIPLGVRILLVALGLAALGAVIWAARRYSVAIKAATDIADRRVAQVANKADEALAAAIDRNRTRAMVSTDPKEAAIAATEVASIEKARGILKGSRSDPAPSPATPH